MSKLVTVKLGDFEKVTYKYEPHRPVKVKQFPWMVCRDCGLLYLRNDITDRAIKLGCYHGYYK